MVKSILANMRKLRGRIADHVYPSDSKLAGTSVRVLHDDTGASYTIAGSDVPLPAPGTAVTVQVRDADRVAGPTADAIWIVAVE